MGSAGPRQLAGDVLDARLLVWAGRMWTIPLTLTPYAGSCRQGDRWNCSI